MVRPTSFLKPNKTNKVQAIIVYKFRMYRLDMEIPFETERHAYILLNSLVQDEEPRSGTSIERFFLV